jgi:hypothetical protein
MPSRTWEQAIESLRKGAAVDPGRGDQLEYAADYLMSIEEPYPHRIAREVLDGMGSYGVSEYGNQAVVEKATRLAYDIYIFMSPEERQQFLDDVLAWFGWEPYEGPDPYG